MSPPAADILPPLLHARARAFTAMVGRHRHLAEMGGLALLLLAGYASLVAQGAIGRLDADAFCVALVGALAWHRRSLRATFALVSLVALAQWLVSIPQNADVAVLIAFFWVTLEGELSDVAVASVVVEIGAVMAALRWNHTHPGHDWVGINGLAIAAGAVGLVIRERRALLATMRERAARLELERDQEGRLGAAAERARIAREMHDIVSHNLTVVIGLADGAGYALDEDPDIARDAIESIAATGRQALGDMRGLLGVLHDDPARGSYEPQPRLDLIDELLERVRAAGVPVEARIDAGAEELPGGVQLAVYRIAQEALTNTLKHAGRPALAELSLRCRPDLVELDVLDSGLPTFESASALGVPRGGRGLSGMRERAAAFGGVLEAGPRPGGAGWQVHLSLPVRAVVGVDS